jgi:hypothetical protein
MGKGEREEDIEEKKRKKRKMDKVAQQKSQYN